MPPVITSISPTSGAVGEDVNLTVRGTNFNTDCTVLFGGIEYVAVIDADNLRVTIPGSDLKQTSLGGLKVQVKQGMYLSNYTLFHLSKASPISMNDIETLVDSITIPDIASLVDDAKNPYLKSVPYIEVYEVKHEDTLQSIAAATIGDPAQWADIAIINNLRYPYISLDEKALTGSVNYTAVTTKQIFSGDTVVSLNGASQFLTANTVLFFALSSPLTDGSVQLLSDVVRIDKVIDDGTSARAVLKSPIFNNYPVGHKVDVLSTNSNTQMRVVKPGDFLMVPSKRSKRPFISGTNVSVEQMYNILGSDISLDERGNMGVDQNGDIQNVIGLKNLNQAISHRLVTEINELVYHSSYGNPLLGYIGYVTSDALTVLAAKELQRTLLSDPRIKQIQQIEAVALGDTIQVRVVVLVDVLNITSEFNFVLPAN